MCFLCGAVTRGTLFGRKFRLATRNALDYRGEYPEYRVPEHSLIFARYAGPNAPSGVHTLFSACAVRAALPFRFSIFAPCYSITPTRFFCRTFAKRNVFVGRFLMGNRAKNGPHRGPSGISSVYPRAILKMGSINRYSEHCAVPAFDFGRSNEFVRSQ